MEIISEVSGRCLEVNADKGEPIPEDGSFALIDDTFMLLELETNQLTIEQAARQLQFDGQEVKRYTRLVAKNSSSQIQLDELYLRRDQSISKLNLLKTERKRLKERHSRHVIKAPAGWLVMENKAEIGEWIGAGQVLAQIGDFDHLVLHVALTPEELLSLKQVHNKIPLIIPASGKHGFGKLSNISPDFNPVTRKIMAEIKVDKDALPPEFVKQGGIRIHISLTIADPMDSFLVPKEAITERYEEHWLTKIDNSLQRVIVLGPAKETKHINGARLRITSPEIKKGDLFLLPEQIKKEK